MIKKHTNENKFEDNEKNPQDKVLLNPSESRVYKSEFSPWWASVI